MNYFYHYMAQQSSNKINYFTKLMPLLNIDGTRRQIYMSAWLSYTAHGSNAVGQYRRVGDVCEWAHKDGIAPYIVLNVHPVSGTETFNSPGAFGGFYYGKAKIQQWASSSATINLPVGFSINHSVLPTVTSTFTIAANLNNSKKLP